MLHILIGLGNQGHNYNICYPFAIAQSADKGGNKCDYILNKF